MKFPPTRPECLPPDSWSLRSWLAQRGIDTVFAVPGADVTDLLESLRQDDRFRVCYATHEFLAGAMAEGYGMASGRPALVISCGGVGASFLVASAAHAAQGDCPVLYLTGLAEEPPAGAACMSGADDSRLFAVAGVWSVRVSHPGELPAALEEAWRQLDSHLPAHVQISVRAQRQGPPEIEGKRFTESSGPAVSAAELLRIPRTVLVAGSAAIPFSDPIRRVCESLSLPLITGMTARGMIPENAEHALGHLGFMPHPGALAATDPEHPQAADQVIALAPSPALQQMLRGRAVPVRTVGGGALETWLEDALALTPSPGEERRAWLRELREAGARHPGFRQAEPDHAPGGLCHGWMVQEAGRTFGPGALHVADAGIFHQAVTALLTMRQPRTMLSSSGLVPMGWSVGAAAGACLAGRGAPVIAFLGDGSFLMHGTGIATAVRYALPVVFIVAVNRVLASARSRHPAGSEDPAALPEVRPEALVSACGAAVRRVATREGFRSALAEAADLKGPLVIVAEAGVSDPCVAGLQTGFASLDSAL